MTEREVLRMLNIEYPEGEEEAAMFILRKNLNRARWEIGRIEKVNTEAQEWRNR